MSVIWADDIDGERLFGVRCDACRALGRGTTAFLLEHGWSIKLDGGVEHLCRRCVSQGAHHRIEERAEFARGTEQRPSYGPPVPVAAAPPATEKPKRQSPFTKWRGG